MKTPNILDDQNIPNRIFSNASIHWWEKKRWIFNLIILLSIFILALQKFSMVEKMGLRIFLVTTLLYLLIGNIFFSLGWVIELLIKFLIPKINFSNNYRTFFLLIGLLFSFGITSKIFYSLLHYDYLEY